MFNLGGFGGGGLGAMGGLGQALQQMMSGRPTSPGLGSNPLFSHSSSMPSPVNPALAPNTGGGSYAPPNTGGSFAAPNSAGGPGGFSPQTGNAFFAKGGVPTDGMMPNKDKLHDLPKEFYDPTNRYFAPSSWPTQQPTDHFAPVRPRWRPQDMPKASPAEMQQHNASPELHGRPVAGLLHSDVPGRTDQLPITVEPGAYVIPADVVSGLGQGNTYAGAQILAKLLGEEHPKFASGGAPIPIIAAGGEYIVHPKGVHRIGGGNISKGHKILDKMVRQIRTHVAKHMMKLPGPRRD